MITAHGYAVQQPGAPLAPWEFQRREPGPNDVLLLGALDLLDPVDGSLLISRRKNLAGTVIGGIAETPEMIGFCAEHGIVSDIKSLAIQDIDQAYRRLARNDLTYRFVVDRSTLREQASSVPNSLVIAERICCVY